MHLGFNICGNKKNPCVPRATIYNELPFIIKTHRQKNWKLLPKLGSQPVAFGPVFTGGLIGFSRARIAGLWLADPP